MPITSAPAPRLEELPPAPSGRTGWPWTEAGPLLDETMPDGLPWPIVSIVTPSFNQAAFIEETIRSVLLQGYPNLEYIIIDGGSTDESVEIINKYSPWLAYWVSEPDHGQSHALNKGFRISNGEVMAYLNSDDIYYPNILSYVVKLITSSNSDILIGAMDVVKLNEGNLDFLSVESPVKGELIHYFPIYKRRGQKKFHFIQPPMFWQREIWEQVGEYSENFNYVMDRHWCLRALACHADIEIRDFVFARFLIHPDSKTWQYQASFLSERIRMFEDLSKAMGFRSLFCKLESWRFRLRAAQNDFYQISDKYRIQKKWTRANITLFVARIIRRLRMGLDIFAQLWSALQT